jgi:hypothetical protein
MFEWRSQNTCRVRRPALRHAALVRATGSPPYHLQDPTQPPISTIASCYEPNAGSEAGLGVNARMPEITILFRGRMVSTSDTQLPHIGLLSG